MYGWTLAMDHKGRFLNNTYDFPVDLEDGLARELVCLKRTEKSLNCLRGLCSILSTILTGDLQFYPRPRSVLSGYIYFENQYLLASGVRPAILDAP